jgi:hypothetical protein
MLILRLVAALLLCLALTPAHADSPPGCEVYWRLTPQWSDTAPRLQVRLSVAGAQASVREWRADADNASLMLGPRHFYAHGPSLLSLPPPLANRSSLQMCLSVEGLDETQILASNLHPDSLRPERLLRWQGSPSLAREIVIAAGSLVQRERLATGLQLTLLLPPALADRADALADEAATALASQRRFWQVSDSTKVLLLLHPDDSGAAPSSAARSGALLLRAPSTALVPAAAFRLGVSRTDLRAWFRERFGPTAYEHQPDDSAGAWFVEGFSLFYALRQAADGGWPLEDFAATLTALWQQDGTAANAAWLPLQWHTSLRRRGGSGIDGVLRKLVVPATQARAAGRLSTPLAGHRLFAALRPTLGDGPRRAVQHLGGPTADPLSTDAFGPCFVLTPSERRVRAASPSTACSAWLAGTGEPPPGAVPPPHAGRTAAKRGSDAGTPGDRPTVKAKAAKTKTKTKAKASAPRQPRAQP